MDAATPLPAGTVTFLFTDIEGSTRLWEQYPEAMREALARHDALLRGVIEASGGAVFKTVGDAFYAIGSGQVDVERGGHVVDVMGPGQYFGEVALLMDVPRTATVRARTPLRAFRVEREGFDRLVADSFRRGRLKPNIVLDRTQEH